MRTAFITALLLLSALTASAANYLPKDAYAGETLVITDCTFQPAVTSEPRRSAGRLSLFTTVQHDAGFAVGCGPVFAQFENLVAGTYDVGVQLDYPDAGFHRLGTLNVAAAAPATPAYTQLSGNWFDPAGPGRGLNIVQGASGALIVVWLTHGTDPFFRDYREFQTPGWFVLPAGKWVSPSLYRGHLYRSGGSPANQPWNPKVLTTYPVGFAALRFASANEMVFEAQFLDSPATTLATTLKRFSF